LFDLLNWQINKTGAGLALEKTRAQLQAAGLLARTMVLEGLVAEGITEYAQNQGMKLIVLSSHGRSGLTQWGLSSTLQKIILRAQTSLLAVRAHQHGVQPGELSTPRVASVSWRHGMVPSAWKIPAWEPGAVGGRWKTA
jgi:hypothetical protein